MKRVLLLLSIALFVSSCSSMNNSDYNQNAINTQATINHHDLDIKGLYAGTPSSIDSYISLAKKHGFNAIVIDFKDDFGNIVYSQGKIKSMIEKLKSNGIYTIARIVAFKDRTKANSNPDMAIRNDDGSVHEDKEKMVWLNPYCQDTQDYVIDIALQAADAGFDEVQFDYIRFPHYKKSVEDTNLKHLVQEKTKIEIINEFLIKATDALHERNVKVSVDVFGCVIPGVFSEESVNLSQNNLGQDYKAIAKIADYVCPMIYPSHWPIDSFDCNAPDKNPKRIVMKSMEASNNALGKELSKKVRPWIQGFSATWLKKGYWKQYTIGDVQVQIDAVKTSGLEGFCLWNSNAKYEMLN